MQQSPFWNRAKLFEFTFAQENSNFLLLGLFGIEQCGGHYALAKLKKAFKTTR